MSATLSPSSNTPQTTPTTYATTPGRRHFWLRRLHSLAGILFGGYIVVHLTVNATGLWPKAYQQNVDKIHGLEPMLPLIELLTIFGPLVLHVVYGIYIAFAGVKFNTIKYNYGGNLRYSLQRWTGIILLLFLIYHIGMLHKWGFASVGIIDQPLFNPKNAAYQSTVSAIKTPFNDITALNIAVMALYLLGVWSAVFHFANGLWTAAIAWGLTVTASAQKRWGHFCLGFGIIMFVIGTTAWAAFTVLGNPEVSTERGVPGSTWTMDHEEAEAHHGDATGGENTNNPIEPGKVPEKPKEQIEKKIDKSTGDTLKQRVEPGTIGNMATQPTTQK